MNAKRCILMKGETQYNVLNCMIDYINISFRKLGYECIVIDLREKNGVSLYKKYCEDGEVDFIFTFNGIGALTIDGAKGYPLAESYSIPSVNFMVDAPFHVAPRLIKNTKYAIYTFVDKEHCAFYENFMDRKAYFIPHGGCAADSGHFVDFSMKKNEVLFMGSFSNPDSVYKHVKEELPNDFLSIFNNILEIMLSDNKKTYMQALLEVNETMGLHAMGDDIMMFGSLLCKADIILRSVRRLEIITALAERGISMTIFGSGWLGTGLAEYKNCDVKDTCPFDYAINRMSESKVVLNVLPLFFNGSHERVFTTILNDSVCATDENLFFKDLFKHEENILFYDQNNLDDLCVSIGRVFDDEELFYKIIGNGKVIANNHTWDNVAEKAISILEERLLQLQKHD